MDNGPDPLVAIECLHEQMKRIGAVLFPGRYQQEREYKQWLEERRRAAVPTKQPIPRALRKAVFERDGFQCVKCGSRWELAADHIHPECKGGEATLENLQTLCKTCNSRKSGRIEPRGEEPIEATEDESME